MAAGKHNAQMDQPVRRNIVVSAVNLRKGGTLTVLRDCLRYLSGRDDLHVTALVHSRNLCDYSGIDYIEIPWSVKGWLRRLWCEYVTMNRISKELPETDLWLSLHDTTPRVKARRQAVYCHTSFPFMKIRARDFVMDAKIPLFAILTKYAYRIFSRRNAYMIVQSSWVRDALSGMIRFDKERIIVAPPAFKELAIPQVSQSGLPLFFYPSTADCHKNFETICEAARLLERSIGLGRFRTVITVRGDENRYASWLRKHWEDVDSLEFKGLLSREELARYYGKAACLIFPSRAETWGLPITEFLPTGKPMILADLPYAHNTAAGASKAAFFPVSDAEALALRMKEVLDGSFTSFGQVGTEPMEPPYASGWEALFEFLLK